MYFQLSKKIKSRIGVIEVSNIVETKWGCGWQEYGAENDDAIDGIILMRRGLREPVDTGGIVFVQVKCGGKGGYHKDIKKYSDSVCLLLGEEYIEKHLPRWKRMPGPAVLIFVEEDSRASWWVDLKSNCYSDDNKSIILIPKSQRFGPHSKGVFHKMCGPRIADINLPIIKISRDQMMPIRLGKNESIRNDAWLFYKNWRVDTYACTHPDIGRIIVNRIGWKHMTRRGRSQDRIINSWLLLGAAKQMVTQGAKLFYLGHSSIENIEDNVIKVNDYLALRSIVVMPHRQETMVQVVLKRCRYINKCYADPVSQKIWLYSIFEPRRGSKIN
jgi:hypothetical protein